MTSREFASLLGQLQLSVDETAKALGVTARTVRRWLNEEIAVPGAVAAAMNAWVRLDRLGLSWRPDGASVLRHESDLAHQVVRHAENDIDLKEVLMRVDARGGPAAPWEVEIPRRRATLGGMWVSFYILRNGGFAPQSYGRKDKPLNAQRDRALLEDAYACIAIALAKERIRLIEAKWNAVEA